MPIRFRIPVTGTTECRSLVSRGSSTSQSRSKSRDKWICNYCKKAGHIKADCRALKAKNEKARRAGNQHHTEEVNYCGSTSTTERVTTKDTHILTVERITEAEVLLTMEESSSWLLDSGASYHVTPFWSQFHTYTARDFEPVRVGNSQHCAEFGIASVELSLTGGSMLVLSHVRHVPDLRRSLILVGQLDETGIRASFSSGRWSLHRGNLLLARGPKVHSLYLLYVTLIERRHFLVDLPVSLLWHGRLRHLSKSGIMHLSRARYIPKLSFSDHQFYKHCQHGKQIVVAHLICASRQSSLLEQAVSLSMHVIS